jgi:cytochrome c551/c552
MWQRDFGALVTGQGDAVNNPVSSIINSSTGKWGEMAMPPHPDLSEAYPKRCANWGAARRQALARYLGG